MIASLIKWSNLFLILLCCSNVVKADNTIPPELGDFIKLVQLADLGNSKPQIQYKKVSQGIWKVAVEWDNPAIVQQDDLQVKVTPAFRASFNWAPHLTPQPNNIIAQHVFRAPAIIFNDEKKSVALIPDLDILKKTPAVDLYLDMDAVKNEMMIGMSNSAVSEHVLFVRTPGAKFPKGKIKLSFYLLTSANKNELQNPWRRPLSFMWQKWGEPLFKNGEPLHQRSLEPYAAQVYNWAFNSWRSAVWQEFELNGRKVGAPVFIVNVTQSPNYKGEVNEREFRSIWNQAWFNSLRSASGLYRYALRAKNDSLKKYALLTKELALQFPQTNGFFPSVIATEMEEVTIDGKKYNRSKGWQTKYFGNSNRNPYTWNPRESPYHVLDMSFTANQMLTWYAELEKDKRLLDYTKRYADALVSIQFADGFFPAWLSLKDFKPLQHLNQSPETAMSVSFLLKLYSVTGADKYKSSALRALNAVMQHNIKQGQWEDFETYWSCSRYGSGDLVGKKVTRNNMCKQNTLAMYYTAEALLSAYNITKNKKYLKLGQTVLDELLMYQATWQPPYMAIRTLGGFGVMNADGEWNDSRQSLFAPLIMQYGKILNNKEYVQRAIAALRASFTMMYTPLNPQTMKQWQARWPFFGKEDYGFMMENYGHDGVTNSSGLGIGEFTIFDWGNGAAAEAYNRIVDHYGMID